MPENSQENIHNTKVFLNLEVLLDCNAKKPGKKLVAFDKLDISMTDDEAEFANAMDVYKKINFRRFPHWSEVLKVLKALGYRKVENFCKITEVKQ